MKLGFITACLPKRTLPQLCEWAAAEGYEALEVAAWPDLGDRPLHRHAPRGRAVRRRRGRHHARALRQAPARALVPRLRGHGAILQANDDIDAVYTHDDDMAEGVVAAIENAGREDEMILTGAGGSCAAFDRIEAGGLYSATYLYSPTMAGSAVNMARLIAQGRGFSDLIEPEVPSQIVVPPTEVNQDNVDDLRDLCFE